MDAERTAENLWFQTDNTSIKRFKMIRYLKTLPMIVGIALIAACGTTNPPTQ
ncbi:MAG: hypothetical protein ACQETF_09545 [Bacteroidota bacterium]